MCSRAPLQNALTRAAYVRAVWRFCAWCEAQRITLRELAATSVAAYFHNLRPSLALASLKLHAAALRHCREHKRWTDADALRQELEHKGIQLMDSPESPRWSVALGTRN